MPRRMPSQIHVRSYAAADSAAIAQLFNDSHERDATIDPMTEASWQAFTRLSFNRGARDFAVAEVDGRVVAVLTSTKLDGEPRCQHFRIVVHPEFRRRGIAGRLFELVERQTAGDGIAQCNCMRAWQPGREFLEARGFEAREIEKFMRWRDTQLPVAPTPSGVTLRPYEPEHDDDGWMRLHRESFGDELNYAQLTTDDIAVERARAGFTMLVAETAGELVGFCHAMRLQGGPCGLIQHVAVVSSQRGRGLGQALMTSMLGRLVAAGCTEVELNVEHDNGPAVRLYERLGFELTDEQYTYRRAALQS